MKIIVTGFEPFGGEDKNPSWEAVKLLPDEIDGCEIIKLELPTEYKNSADAVICKISEVSPDYVIMTGVAGGRDGITPEVIAINYADSSSPDNAGTLHMGEHLINDAPAAYFSTLPYIDMVKALRESGFKSMPSHSAGAYVCNDTMYRVLHFLSESKSHIRAGFIHVPYADICTHVPNKSPSMPLSEISEALAICIKVCIK